MKTADNINPAADIAVSSVDINGDQKCIISDNGDEGTEFFWHVRESLVEGEA